MIKLELPLPPTANNLFCNGRNGKGRFINPIYAQWRWAAMHALSTQKPTEKIVGKYHFRLFCHPKMRGDLDNRLKAPLDFCVAHAITPDDKHAKPLADWREDVKPGFCLIEIEEAS